MRFHALDTDIVRQKQALKDVGWNGTAVVAAAKVLRLLEQEQDAIIQELGYNPRSN